MTDTLTVTTDAAIIESILERGFDPTMPIHRNDFLQFIADAEAIDAAGTQALPPVFSRMGERFGETGEALLLPVAIGHRWLVRLLDSTPVKLEPTAIDDAIAALARRLVTVVQQLVQFEAIVSRSARGVGGDATASRDSSAPLLNAWLDRWQMFPVLASLITLSLANWIRAIEEMIRALEHDHTEIEATLTHSMSPLTITAIDGNAGDLHLGGRSVMILTFADGAQVVFKPKQLAITDVLRTLVDRINAAGWSAPLRVHRAIVRERHTWEEYIPHRSCDTEAQVERFYRRMGGWIRLLQMLEGRDFWLDNLIADGEDPIFIDLETILQPRRRDAELPAAAELAQDRIESSPLVTNIIAMPMPIGPGIEAEELGCFAAPRDFLSPFAATEIAGVTDVMSRRGYRTWTHPEHAPMLRGEPVRAEMWYPAIEAGYREMAETINALSPELLERGGLVDQLCAHPVRTIFRDTWTCIRVIHRSTAPPLLGSSARRRTFLEQMGLNASDEAAPTGPVIAAEVRAMMSLDVPFFTAYGNADAIHPPDAAAVPAFFDGTPRDRVASNLRDFSRQRLEDDVALLRTSFWTAHPGTPPGAMAGIHAPQIANGDWLAAARAIATTVADARLEANDGTSSWIALTYHPTADIETWSPIGSDLLSGRAGLAVFYSDMWQATGEDRWRNLAIESARDVAASVRQVFDAWAASSRRQSSTQQMSPLVGAFVGAGGMLATVKLVSDVCDDVSLGQSWRALLTSHEWSRIPAGASSDVIGGAVGLGLALTARRQWIDELGPEARETVASIAGQEGDATTGDYPPSALQKLAGLPGERVGRLLARSRIAVDRGFDVQPGIDGILDDDPTPGDLLGVIELSALGTPWWARLEEAVIERFDERRAASDRLAQLDAAELALAMWRSSSDIAWRDRVQLICERWIADFNASGSWFPSDLADDRYRLSVVRGLPALASVLLRLAGAPAVASCRTLDWQPWEAR